MRTRIRLIAKFLAQRDFCFDEPRDDKNAFHLLVRLREGGFRGVRKNVS